MKGLGKSNLTGRTDYEMRQQIATELKDKDLRRHKKEKERLNGDWHCSRYKVIKRWGGIS